MIRTLRTLALKTGERMRVAALRAPAGRYADAIRRFLNHKGQPWLLHVDLANQGKTDRLNTTYTIGLAGTAIVGNVMIVDDGRVGILGHVFTDPAHRRKGICQHLMAGALEDFTGRGGLALGLGTGYNSPAYWIYHAFGFRSVGPGSGHMLFEATPGAIARSFAPARASVRDALWHDWPGISLLLMQPAGDRLRCKAYGVTGPDGFEGGFLQLQSQRERLQAQAKVLATHRGIAGFALLQRDPQWPSGIHTLDFFVHPSFREHQNPLLRSLDLPRDAKIQAYVDRPSTDRSRALRGLGFRREVILSRQLRTAPSHADVLLYALST